MVEQPSKKLNMIDKLTLEYLADGYRQTTELVNTEILPLEDIKFYRKRINNMIKESILDLIKNNGKKIEKHNNTIDTLLFNTIKECIKELKHQDWMELQNNWTE